MENHEIVGEQYGESSLAERVNQALAHAGLENGTLNWSDLVPLDQFHVRGLGATKELAEALGVQPGWTLLDVGSGLGGPARFLAATCNCSVTGIDLSQPYVDVATNLTERCGLSASVNFQRADALDLPFDDASFDVVWTQHVAMNISNRAKWYSEIRRALKPGGHFAIYDIIAGDGRPLHFPVPWARRPELSFLVSAAEMKELLARAGFKEVSWRDKTDASLLWFAELKARMQNPSPLGLPVVLGPQFIEMARNLDLNLQEGRAKIVQAVMTTK